MIGLMSRPGIQPAATRATRATWFRSLSRAGPAPGYCTLTATSRPSLPDRPVHLPDRGRGRREVVERPEPLPPARPEVLGQHAVHRAGRHRRRGVLQLGQRRAVGPGQLLGQRGLEDRQGLAELHRPALELAQDLEHLLGRARPAPRRRRPRPARRRPACPGRSPSGRRSPAAGWPAGRCGSPRGGGGRPSAHCHLSARSRWPRRSRSAGSDAAQPAAAAARGASSRPGGWSGRPAG